MRTFRPLQEPIRLQNLLNSARSRAEKKINVNYYTTNWSKIKKRILIGFLNGPNFQQLLDEIFVVFGIFKVEVSVISRSQWLRLIALAETMIISEIIKAESNNCFIIHCFKENNDKRIIAQNTVYFLQAMFSYFALRELDIAL